jgi:hypothetical protein
MEIIRVHSMAFRFDGWILQPEQSGGKKTRMQKKILFGSESSTALPSSTTWAQGQVRATSRWKSTQATDGLPQISRRLKGNKHEQEPNGGKKKWQDYHGPIQPQTSTQDSKKHGVLWCWSC